MTICTAIFCLFFFFSGRQQEALAVSAGFEKAIHYPVGFGLMGVLVAFEGQ